MLPDRVSAYAEVLRSLLGLRPDPATTRFDILLAELLAAGRIDPESARELRWWQRESVRAVVDYAGEAVPAALAAAETAAGSATDTAEMAARAWAHATGADGPPPPPPAPPAPEAPGDGCGACVPEQSDTAADPADTTGAGPSAGRLGIVVDLRPRSTGRDNPSDTGVPESLVSAAPVASPRPRLLASGLLTNPDRPDEQ